MSFDPGLTRGQILTNNDLYELFQCGNNGGMRRSRATNTLVLISDHTKSLYDDKWYGNEFHYTGMGKVGPQSLEYMQNKTLAESAANGVDVHLFEVFKPNNYVYQGLVKLVKKPYQEAQLDDNDAIRQVWMFPLKLTVGIPARFSEVDVDKVNEKRAKKARRLNQAKLKKLVEGKERNPGTKRETTSTSYDRDQNVVEYALRRANGICQLCEQPAPFNRKDGTPYLEVHHIVYLNEGGSDTIDNVAALCPNDHRKMHALEDPRDIKKLLILAKEILL